MSTERPIPFSAPMVRAILAGTKTQTRRALAPDLFISSGGAVVRMKSAVAGVTGISEAQCPYWRQPGDRLLVREAWTTHACFDHIPPRDLTTRSIHYLADGQIKTGKYRPPMFMPRWASRITLEVTGVRVERLQAISEADARAEGYELGAPPCIDAPLRWYRHLWDQINGAGAWDANPWVWVVEFRRVTP
jgi:hypothetical protein